MPVPLRGITSSLHHTTVLLFLQLVIVPKIVTLKIVCAIFVLQVED